MIVYDLSTGIKTLLMKDGTVKEEPFDRADLPGIKAEQERGKARISIVNEQAPTTLEDAASDGQKKPNAPTGEDAAPSPLPTR